jgi:hypothetical protein
MIGGNASGQKRGHNDIWVVRGDEQRGTMGRLALPVAMLMIFFPWRAATLRGLLT